MSSDHAPGAERAAAVRHGAEAETGTESGSGAGAGAGSTAVRLHHRLDGPAGAPLLVLGPSLGTTLEIWEPQMEALTASWRVLRYDLPGHGGSAPAGGSSADESAAEPSAGVSGVEPEAVEPVAGSIAAAPAAGLTVDALAQAVLELVGEERFAIGGISLGGAIAATVAARVPGRVTGLVLCCTSARFGEPGPWRERAAAVRREGMRQLAPTLVGRWFTPRFAEGDPGRISWVLEMLHAVDPGSYAACCEAIAGYDLTGGLSAITAPTLVVAGAGDPATPVEHALTLVRGIDGALLTVVPGAHLASVERAAAVTSAVTRHLHETGVPTDSGTGSPAGTGSSVGNGPSAGDGRSGASAAGGSSPRRDERPIAGTRDDDDRRAAGMRTRREVLGDEHVERAIARTTAFTEDFQDLITRYAWDEIWNRPGLDRRTRSCVTLTALVAGGHLEELAMHVRAALRNGLTPDEIKEVLLQTAIYCGVPAANAAFAVAQRTLAESGA
ncbi:bifunctional 3-oxoadipate enol-lactonase/4-carboxymuconolactone decarboxylase PcaDC [Planobispora takensis]|uniref:3-oxoadipate enol-lactonase n=1 Tax=Planobispora takensis TaxID=1367882 RepID=A0A8J3T3Q0_9ACTN|nr:4-carboxymuconolactone decarboxylase [Planobispora takensis]GII05143.1 3-oxoadipate enol-lactonase [Planobispora takensis]